MQALALFVAIELHDRVKAAMTLARGRLHEFDRVVRWTAPEQMHLTIQYLGACEDDERNAIHEACLELAEQCDPFELTLSGGGCFPPQGRVRVVWVGADDRTGRLAECGERGRVRLAGLGFAGERRAFTPHITLGRVRDDRSGGRLRSAVAAAAVEPARQTVTEMVLMRSDRSASGARYTAIGRFGFGGG